MVVFFARPFIGIYLSFNFFIDRSLSLGESNKIEEGYENVNGSQNRWHDSLQSGQEREEEQERPITAEASADGP